MTGLERMRCAFKHIEGDRVPIYEQGVAWDVATSILGRPAMTGLTGIHRQEAEEYLKSPEAGAEFGERVMQDCVDLAKALDLDAVSPSWIVGSTPTRKLDDLTYLYGDPNSDNYVIRKYDPYSDTMGVVECSMDKWTIEDLEAHVLKMEATHHERAIPGPSDFPSYLRLKELAGDMAVVSGSVFVIPLEQIWLEAIALRPDVIDRYLEMQLDYSLDYIRAMAQMEIEFIWGGGDMAANQGPVYSPTFFRKYMLPRWKKISALCRELGVYYVFRTDGNLWSIADDVFVEAGFDGYGEIDVDAGMEMGPLKSRYGHLTFWGNISCGRTLRLGTEAEVVDATKKLIDEGAAGGGLVVGSSNTILYGTPPENFLAMVNTAKSYGKY